MSLRVRAISHSTQYVISALRLLVLKILRPGVPVGEEGDSQKLDDVRVAYGAHQLALSHELGRGLGQLVRPSMQDGVDCFGGGFHGKGHLLHLAIGPAANGSTSELDVGENERPQLGMVAEIIFLHFCPLIAKIANSTTRYSCAKCGNAQCKYQSRNIVLSYELS